MGDRQAVACAGCLHSARYRAVKHSFCDPDGVVTVISRVETDEFAFSAQPQNANAPSWTAFSPELTSLSTVERLRGSK
jgi:hypothetical protein